jgi:3-dehydroquinate synthetase
MTALLQITKAMGVRQTQAVMNERAILGMVRVVLFPDVTETGETSVLNRGHTQGHARGLRTGANG